MYRFFTAIIMCLTLLILASCGSTSRIAMEQFTIIESSAKPGFEHIDFVYAEDILPKHLLASNYHTIDAKVQHDGRNYIFHVVSDFGFFEARGIDALHALIKEIRAIAIMRHIRTSREFRAAISDSTSSPVHSVGRIVTNPLRTAVNIPKGLIQYTRELTSLAFEDRSKYEDSRTRELIGFSDIKRRYAALLGVDVYADNLPLQDHLNHLAWVTYTGKFPIKAATAFIPTLGAALVALNAAKDLDDTVLLTSAEDLRHKHRNLLSDLNVSTGTINDFVGGQYLSPHLQLHIMKPLEKLGPINGAEGVISIATKLTRPFDIYQLGKSLELLASIHENDETVSLASIHSWNNMVMAETNDKHLFISYPSDHALWNERLYKTLQHIDQDVVQIVKAHKIHFVSNDKGTPLLRHKLYSMGWSFNQHRIEDHYISLAGTDNAHTHN